MALLRLSEVNPVPYSYLWYPYVFWENLSLLAGDGGTGKSFLALAIAAAITTGKQPEGMPGQMMDGAGNVLYLTTEDQAEQIAARVVTLGGDRNRIAVYESQREEEGRIRTDDFPSLDKPELLAGYIRDTSARLVIFDPIQSYISGADMNRASEVRPLLDGLRMICREEHCAALLIAHSNKGEKMGKAQYRVSGTGDFVNGCRSAMLVGFHPSEAGIRVAAHMKSNGEYGASFRFTVDDTGCFRWLGKDTSTAEEIMNAPRIKRANNSVISVNPVTLLIEKEIEKHGGAWEVSSSELPIAARAYPELLPLHTLPYVSIGYAVREDLKKRGITSTRPNRNHKWFFSRA